MFFKLLSLHFDILINLTMFQVLCNSIFESKHKFDFRKRKKSHFFIKNNLHDLFLNSFSIYINNILVHSKIG